jgi:glycosidase
MEFHIARPLRERLELSDALFSYTGNVVFANVAGARKLAAGLNALRSTNPAGAADDDTSPVNSGALFAMGLIDELSHAMIARYREEVDPAVLTEALVWFAARLGEDKLQTLLLTFAEKFPGTSVFRGETTAAHWLAGTTGSTPHRESELEELLILWLANRNPAFQHFRELFADEDLRQQTAYPTLVAAIPTFFETRPPVSSEAGSLIDALLAPMLASPDSLVGQLEFMRENWTPYLGTDLKRALLAIDVVREEDVAIWMRFHPPTGRMPRRGEPGLEAHGFSGDEYVGFDQDFVMGADGIRRPRQYSSDHQAPLVEFEAFSADHAWMPTVVMMAKSTYVWLEQLSKKYKWHIHRLDQIPDSELEELAGRGMTALWLIGLWERSSASRTIKRLRGQPDAVASAYSLKEYNIAEDLGGNRAYESLRDRAAAYGLRLASDMVPNHMGIDSPWVIEHPEWFITRDDSPFPVYRFDGPDLSNDSRAEIKIEDHYYDQTDAAVAFRLRTYRDNRTHFMYHGNDGTTFAWNDTAQLDYSKASVREHIIQTILHVARLFPIIRFDAAMVLAKRHVQRLWFPLPGVGGSIPSRAENAMSQEEFDALMPNEFWREVVDRVAVEVPGTLLLAEAFWLLEGYFVRTLGMHRVYNSAFMNMLRDEENAKYRSYLKKTIEFDPDILKRYVNFMSNPDEKTAAEQFGDGDKYFGTCTLLATLPGLPMFAHGQVEGFTERYGMDFKEAKRQETPNEGLIARYYREITPLLRNRKLFAESEHFVLYDLWTGDGNVDENVIAYSNRLGDERAVILYNNIYASTHGTIHTSCASVDKGSGMLVQRTLVEALALSADDKLVVAYRDSNQGLEYLRRASDLRDRGLTVGLHGYQYLVLQQWRQLRSTAEQPWDRLCDSLHGAGVPSLEDAVANLRLRPLHDALRDLLSSANLHAIVQAGRAKPHAMPERAVPAMTPIVAAEPVASEPGPIVSAPPKVNPVAAGPAAVKPIPDDAVAPPAPATEPVTATASATEHDPLLPLVAAGEHFYHRLADMDPTLAAAPGPAAPVESTPPPVPYGEALRLATAHAAHATLSPVSGGESITLQNAASILAWAALSSLPAAVDKPALFDRLRLRSALAEVFPATGLHGEEAWRGAARIRVPLTFPQPVAESIASDTFWNDPDVQWLTGRSEAHGTTFFSKEPFEDLIRWLDAVGPAGGPSYVDDLARSAEVAGYKLDAFRAMVRETGEPEPADDTRLDETVAPVA